MIRELSKPAKHRFRLRIDLALQSDLHTAFRVVLLVDTYGVDPEGARFFMMPELHDDGMQIFSIF